MSKATMKEFAVCGVLIIFEENRMMCCRRSVCDAIKKVRSGIVNENQVGAVTSVLPIDRRATRKDV
jgi:hypothetical protein